MNYRLGAHAAVDRWNKKHAVGDVVFYRDDHGALHETKTRTPASVLGGHTAVIWVDCEIGCVALERIHTRASA
jgi:hypothetical protein